MDDRNRRNTHGAYSADGRVVLEATALDPDDGNLSAAIQWSSSIDGVLGNGSYLEVFLSAGTHELTTTVEDLSGNDESAVRVVRVGNGGGNLDLSSYALESFTNQDNSGSAEVSVDGSTLTLWGNTWKQIQLPYTLTENTYLEFEFSSNVQGEIHGIGLVDSNSLGSTRIFRVYGTQLWGLGDYATFSGSGWVSYRIPVGNYYTGDVTHLVFVADDDINAAGQSQFRNVRLVSR